MAGLGKTAFLEFRSHEIEKWEARNSSQHLRTRSLVCPPWTVLRNRSETDNSAVNVYTRSSEEIHANYIVN